jgi:hypothetical protein
MTKKYPCGPSCGPRKTFGKKNSGDDETRKKNAWGFLRRREKRGRRFDRKKTDFFFNQNFPHGWYKTAL